ncbi:unnamed protein product [Caenorhabditis angaria]|uniref:Aminoacyl-transfer RNA synthetases class-II family profile domain-containing protein n=1 Tax=Caenorhabditis angaria TaxID=860376 RepID=A0A9P1N4P4_9PELO|nr:unnamed protein product [Caenorhabditis angaria]
MLRIFRRRFSSFCDYTIRTHTCDELTAKNIDEKVSIMGWLAFKRMDRFLVVRDSYGTIQAKLPQKLSSLVKDLPYESVIRIDGKVVDRGDKNRNLNMKTGEIEIEVEELEILNRSSKDIPFLPDEKSTKSHEKTRLKYRYIDLRSAKMQRSLRIRSEFVHNLRKFLVDQKKFVDVETPTLFRRTPGGAAEFVVPAPQPNLGQAYSLPQSPQQFKQLLMVGGIDRYFQIARCYRDEGSKGDRQPEFTQVDIEMSFTTQNGIMQLIEQMIVSSWPSSLSHLKPKLPFPRVKYSEVMENYGSDKPDFRIPWKIEKDEQNIFDILKTKNSTENWNARFIVCKNASEKVSNSLKKEWKRLIEMNENGRNFAICQKNHTLKSINLSEIPNFDVENDTLIVSWGESEGVNWTLGYLRNYVAELNGLRQKSEVQAHWVIDFPLFSRENGQMVSTHHPFTAPISEHQELLNDETRLEDITGQHYDLVINGVEMGGGSIRIHNSDIQKHVLQLLNEPMEEMNHLLEALSFGAPPHGGFALGLDRFVALLTSEGDPTTPVRDVIAFPKTKNGRDLMSDSPTTLDAKQIERYGIQLKS